MEQLRGLFAVVREKLHARHMSYRTKQAYLPWAGRLVRFHGRRHLRELGPADVEAFLTHLPVQRKRQQGQRRCFSGFRLVSKCAYLLPCGLFCNQLTG